VRIFDLGRPDAEPDLLLAGPDTVATHASTVKSVVWVGDTTGVSAGEDGQIKYVTCFLLHPRSIAGMRIRIRVLRCTEPLFCFFFARFRFRWWDLRSRQLVTTVSFPDPITSMELSTKTHRLVVTSGKTVAFIPATAGDQTPAHTLALPYAPSSASIHPTLKDRFVTGNTADEWVRVHGLDGTERDVLKGHHGPVHCVEFSPDGEMFASGSGEFLIDVQYVFDSTPDLYRFFLLSFLQRMARFVCGRRRRGSRTVFGKDNSRGRAMSLSLAISNLPRFCFFTL
jgi:serine-threonine kinase receptor-associated protein